jgi:cation diffusion facilitator CzcD-associated flavoprotein CzcO
VLATGAFQRPAIPSISKGLSAEVKQLAPEDYTSPSQLPPGRVLVVGDGATGRQIALELTANHEVLLAAGRHRRVSPDRILGKSGGIAVLLVILVMNVYKPQGMTQYGWRKQQEQRRASQRSKQDEQRKVSQP